MRTQLALVLAILMLGSILVGSARTDAFDCQSVFAEERSCLFQCRTTPYTQQCADECTAYFRETHPECYQFPHPPLDEYDQDL